MLNRPLAVYLRKESEFYLGVHNEFIAALKYFRQSHNPAANMTIRFVNNNCHKNKNEVFIKINGRFICKCGSHLELCRKNPLKFTLFLMKYGFLIKHKNLCLTRNKCTFNFRSCEQKNYDRQLFNFRFFKRMENKLNHVKKLMTHGLHPFRHKKCRYMAGIGRSASPNPSYITLDDDSTHLSKIQDNILEEMNKYKRDTKTSYESGIILDVLNQL